MSQLDRDYARRLELLTELRQQQRNQVNAGIWLYGAAAVFGALVALAFWVLSR